MDDVQNQKVQTGAFLMRSTIRQTPVSTLFQLSQPCHESGRPDHHRSLFSPKHILTNTMTLSSGLNWCRTRAFLFSKTDFENPLQAVITDSLMPCIRQAVEFEKKPGLVRYSRELFERFGGRARSQFRIWTVYFSTRTPCRASVCGLAQRPQFGSPGGTFTACSVIQLYNLYAVHNDLRRWGTCGTRTEVCRGRVGTRRPTAERLQRCEGAACQPASTGAVDRHSYCTFSD